MVYKNEAPKLNNQLLCSTGLATLQAEDGISFSLFADPGKSQNIYTGTSYTTPALSGSTTYYASTGSGVYESDLIPVKIDVAEAGINYDYVVDSTASEKYALRLTATISNPEKAARIDWFINGGLKGNGIELQLPYTIGESSISVQVIVYYQNGCQANVEREIILSTSPKPQINSTGGCRGSIVCIRPQNDGLYYFYNDAEQQQLIRKGREYTTEALMENTILYVTNVSLGHESEATVVNLTVAEELASFTTSSDSIPPGTTVFFRSTHPEAASWHWNFGNGITSDLVEPVQTFEKEGSYSVSLTAGNSSGCKETSVQTIFVSSLTGIINPRPAILLLDVYPNPVREELRIKLPIAGFTGTLTLFDLRGRCIKRLELSSTQESLLLDVRQYGQGWYLLQLKNKGILYQSRFLKN